MRFLLTMLAVMVASDVAGIWENALWFVTAFSVLAFGAFAVYVSLHLPDDRGRGSGGDDSGEPSPPRGPVTPDVAGRASPSPGISRHTPAHGA